MGMVTEAMKAKAEVCHGDKNCRDKFSSWLSEMGVPNKLLSFHHEIEECGYVKDTGFVWLKRETKKKLVSSSHAKDEEHLRFDNVVVSFEDEVTAYLEPNKIKNLKGVKAKELCVWISLCEIHVNHSSRWITFKTHVGFSKSFPLSVFEAQKLQQEADDHGARDKHQKVQHMLKRTKIYLY